MLTKIALTGKIRAILITAGVAAVLGVVAALAIQTKRLDAAQARNGELQVRLDTAVAANKTNQETIDALKDANQKLLERIRLDAMAAEAAAREATERAAELRRQRDYARRQLDITLSSTPSCEALAKLDLATACPALRERLLSLSERNRQD